MPSCLRTLDGEAPTPSPISPQVDGPLLSRKRMIWLRVRFIKMFDMETAIREVLYARLAVDGSTAADYASQCHVERPWSHRWIPN